MFFKSKFIQSIILSSVFLQLGVWIRNFSVLLFVMEQTNSNSSSVALVSTVELLPIFLFSLVGGIYSDRWLPKTTMIRADFLSGLSVFIILMAISLGAWKAVYLIVFISASLAQFSQSSRMRLFKMHLKEEQMQMGMAAYQTFMAILAIIGPVIGTFIYNKFGINMAIAATGMCFVFSAAVLTLIPNDKKIPSEKVQDDFWIQLKEGLQFIRNEKVLTLLGGVFTAFGFAAGVIQPLGVFIVTERLGLPKENFQWLLSINGSAMLIGGSFVMMLAKRISPERLLFMGLLINAINVIGIALSTNWYLTLAIQFINGLFTPCIHIGINTLILNTAKEKFVGRVNGILTLMSIAAMVIATSLAGLIKVKLSLVTMYGISSVFFVLGVLITIPLSQVIILKQQKLAS